MKNYVRDMKRVIGFAAILVLLLAEMNFVGAGNATAAVPSGAGIANVESNFNPAFNRPFFNRPAFVRPAFNPFFAQPSINPFFAPFVDVDEFGADFD